MKNGTDKRIKVYLESLGEGVNYERLFRAMNLILSEDDLKEYLLSNQKNILSSSLEKCRDGSSVIAERLANS